MGSCIGIFGKRENPVKIPLLSSRFHESPVLPEKDSKKPDDWFNRMVPDDWSWVYQF